MRVMGYVPSINDDEQEQQKKGLNLSFVSNVRFIYHEKEMTTTTTHFSTDNKSFFYFRFLVAVAAVAAVAVVAAFVFFH